MDQNALDLQMAEFARALRDLNIPISRRIDPAVRVNTRAKCRLGCCYRLPARDGERAEGTHWDYAIEVSASLLDRPEQLRETLLHELLHTCPGCQNHGAAWKAWAAKAGEAFGVSIRRLAPAEEGRPPKRREPIKYVLECRSCGAKIARSRLSKAVLHPERYRCKCGGKLKRVL